MGPRPQNYINKVWQGQQFVLQQSGFYSDAINIDRGCT